MKNLTLRDDTQKVILDHLRNTESLISYTASKLSGSERAAEIWAMPDLGLPRNMKRVHGGFFTGALYSWNTDVPFVPIDATVNSCGVSAFRLEHGIESKEHFDELIATAIARTQDKSSYTWNFTSGNHFIIYGKVKDSKCIPEGHYLILHSSAAEFKYQDNGLYPTEGNWFSDQIEIITYPSAQHRYLRYIKGKAAERFFRIAHMMREFNELRHQYFAETLIGARNIVEEIINIQHYGMPSQNSVAIGCQWHTRPNLFLLLTAPNKPLYFVQPQLNHDNHFRLGNEDILLTPHGLGVMSKSPMTLEYEENTITISGKNYKSGESLWDSSNNIGIRDLEYDQIVTRILSKCPGIILAQVDQIYSLCGAH